MLVTRRWGVSRFVTFPMPTANPNITLGVRRMIGANVVETMDGVMAKTAELNAAILGPRGLRVSLSSEDVQYVKDAVMVVARNLFIGAGLAVVVLFLFLRFTFGNDYRCDRPSRFVPLQLSLA